MVKAKPPTLKSAKLTKGQVVIVRTDYNLPLGSRGEILDDFRLRQSLPTLEFLLKRGCAVIVFVPPGPAGRQIGRQSEPGSGCPAFAPTTAKNSGQIQSNLSGWFKPACSSVGSSPVRSWFLRTPAFIRRRQSTISQYRDQPGWLWSIFCPRLFRGPPSLPTPPLSVSPSCCHRLPVC